jgi:hypothetical protein
MLQGSVPLQYLSDLKNGRSFYRLRLQHLLQQFHEDRVGILSEEFIDRVIDIFSPFLHVLEKRKLYEYHVEEMT